MLMTNDRSRPFTPVRSRSPHSRTIAASKSPSTRSAISMPATPGNAWRGPGAGSLLTTRTVLPRARSAKPSASCEPIESPSGRACDESTKCCRARIAAAICCSSGGQLVVGVGIGVGARMNLAEDLLDAVLAGDRFVVDEDELRHQLQPEP